MRLAGKTAVVTGAASGIGRATATRFAEEGATVVATDVDVEGGRETARQIEAAGGDAEFRELDVTDYDAFDDLLTAVHEEYDGLDVLHNNAGILGPVKPLEEITLEERSRLIDINVNGVWNGCHAAVPLLKAQESGAIVNTASNSGFLASPEVTTYCLTKAAVLNFTRAVAHEVGPHGVRVNAICPGMTDTGMLDTFYEGAGDPEAMKAEFAEEFSLKRIADPVEMANAVLFLASDEASFVTGEALVVDGGFSIH
jgi:NAD(P)-dependent dehydrogenase (short-subunit alcohol dehydrogenase family)